jgi:hypothetical protein
MDAADLKPKTYRDRVTCPVEEKVITPPRATALSLWTALQDLRDAEAALDAAEESVPSYTGQWNPRDYFGPQEEALNRAIDAFEDALVASARVRTSDLSDGR